MEYDDNLLLWSDVRLLPYPYPYPYPLQGIPFVEKKTTVSETARLGHTASEDRDDDEEEEEEGEGIPHDV